MDQRREVVITGIGVLSPIGIDKRQYWSSLCEGRSGVGLLEAIAGSGLPSPIGGQVPDFQPKNYVRPRKNMKVMSRDIQMGFVAADLAWADANIAPDTIDPERLGVIFGADLIAAELEEVVDTYRRCMVDGRFDFSRWGPTAMAEIFPLWMLKYLPNMPACHIAIGHDARGPNDSITLREVSGLAAVAEAVRVIERGQADWMIAGSTGSQVHPSVWAQHGCHQMSARTDQAATACRPFDAGRDGMVHGEGAAAFILENRRDAEARGAKILARVLGFAHTFQSRTNNRPPSEAGIRRAIIGALAAAGLKPSEIGHVNADGRSTILDDRLEARAIRDTLGDVPVTAPKSFFGNLSGGAGSVEMVASLLGLEAGLVPPTLNYERPDPECPVNVVHGRPLEGTRPTALLLNHAQTGSSVAVVVAAP
jgi:3-oxoacyl-[acyl-carrier-protein] synthase II